MAFLFYVSFISLAVLNILTGIFVNNAMRVSEEDHHGHVKELIDERHKQEYQFEQIYRVIADVANEPYGITEEKFVLQVSSSEALQTRLSSMQIEIIDASTFFKMIVG